MKRRFFLLGLAFTVLTFAVAGWTVRGVRWALAA
jgi:hypothetical protein